MASCRRAASKRGAAALALLVLAVMASIALNLWLKLLQLQEEQRQRHAVASQCVQESYRHTEVQTKGALFHRNTTAEVRYTLQWTRRSALSNGTIAEVLAKVHDITNRVRTLPHAADIVDIAVHQGETSSSLGLKGIIRLRTCPWLVWDSTGFPMYPRGISWGGDPNMVCTVKALTVAALHGELIWRGMDGTALASMAGGYWGHDNDLDVEVEFTSASRVKNTVEYFKYAIPSGEAAHAVEYTGVTNRYLEPDEFVEGVATSTCICQYSGVMALCDNRATPAVVAERAGFMWWIPLPGAKQLQAAFHAQESWVIKGKQVVPVYARWRAAAVEALRKYDSNSDGEIELLEAVSVIWKKLDVRWVVHADNSCTVWRGLLELQRVYPWLLRVDHVMLEVEAQGVSQNRLHQLRLLEQERMKNRLNFGSKFDANMSQKDCRSCVSVLFRL